MKGEVRKLQKGVAAAVVVEFLMVVTVSLSLAASRDHQDQNLRCLPRR